MAQKYAYIGDPIIHDRTLDILLEKYGPRRGFELYKSALVVRHLGWFKVKKLLNRSSVFRLRRELIAAGLLSAYEDDVSLDEILQACVE